MRLPIEVRSERCQAGGRAASGHRYQRATPGRLLAVAIENKPAGRFMIRSRIRVVKRHREDDW
jgi:hypothetical protein